MIVLYPYPKTITKEPDKPKDWPFMEQSGKILADIPDTWRAYPNTEKGKMDIIVMEYNELRNAMTDEEKMHELVHVASACLNLWRCLNAKHSAS